MKLIPTFPIVIFAAATSHAAITGFQAESGTLGSEYNTGADVTALGGSYIEHASDNFTNGATQPNTDGFTVSYNLNLAAGTYDVYVKMRFASNGEDSFFMATDFGDTDPTVTADWQKIDNIMAYGGNGASAPNFTWSSALTPTLTTTGGPVTWEIGAREAGNDIDAFAFVSSGDTVTATELDNAVVPEPSSFALLAGIFGLASIMLRRRR